MLNKTKESKLIEALNAVQRDFECAVLREIQAHPTWPYWRVGEQLGISEATVHKIAKNNHICRPAGPCPKSSPEEEGC